MTEHHQQYPERRVVERAMVLQLLRDDHDQRWSRTELEAEINDVESAALAAAVERLAAEGVVVVEGGHIVVSRCVRRLDELGLVSV